MSNSAEALELQRTMNTRGWQLAMKIAADICEGYAMDAIDCEGTDEERLQLLAKAHAARRFVEKLQNVLHNASQL